MTPSDRKSGLELVSSELRKLADKVEKLDPNDIEGMSDAAFQADICVGSLDKLKSDAITERLERERMS